MITSIVPLSPLIFPLCRFLPYTVIPVTINRLEALLKGDRRIPAQSASDLLAAPDDARVIDRADLFLILVYGNLDTLHG